MPRIIVNVDEGIEVENALAHVQAVIQGGLISKTCNGPQYCFHTIFKDGISASAFLTRKGTHTFRVSETGKEEGYASDMSRMQ